MAVQLVSEIPARYVAANTRKLLERLTDHTITLCDSLTERLEKFAPPIDDPHVWTIRGNAVVHARVEKMIAASSRSIWIKASDDILRLHRQSLLAAAERGVSQLIILFGNDACEFRFAENCQVYIHEGDGVRTGVADNLFTLATDHEEMLTATRSDDVVGVYTRNRAMVSMALSLIRHDYYMAEICEPFRGPIVEAYGPL